MRTVYAESVIGPFDIAPQDQGQMVEVAYAWVEGGDMVRRKTDRSDKSVAFEFLVIDEDAIDKIDVPNGDVPLDCDVIKSEPCVLVEGSEP